MSGGIVRNGVRVRGAALPAALVSALAIASLLTGALPALAQGSIGAQLEAKKAQAIEVRQTLDTLRKQLSAELAKYDQVSAQLAETRRQVAVETDRLAVLERDLAHQQGRLDSFVVSAYRSGELGTIAAVLGATTFEDLFTRVRLTALIGERQGEVIEGLRGSRDESRRLKESLDQRNVELVAQREQAEAQRARVEDNIARQDRILDSLAADIAALLKELERARAAGAGKMRYDANAAGARWMTTPSLLPGAYGTVAEHPGRLYLIPAGVPAAHRSLGYSWQGVASWYGNAENGTATSSGRPYNENEMTCAHKTLPLGTLLAVSRGDRHVIVVVTDRGPYIPGRDIDLSRAASSALGFDGVSPVDAELVAPLVGP